MPASTSVRAPQALGVVLILVALALVVEGAMLVAVGGSWFYLLAAVGLAAAGILLVLRQAGRARWACSRRCSAPRWPGACGRSASTGGRWRRGWTCCSCSASSRSCRASRGRSRARGRTRWRSASSRQGARSWPSRPDCAIRTTSSARCCRRSGDARPPEASKLADPTADGEWTRLRSDRIRATVFAARADHARQRRQAPGRLAVPHRRPAWPPGRPGGDDGRSHAAEDRQPPLFLHAAPVGDRARRHHRQGAVALRPEDRDRRPDSRCST